MTGFSQLIKSYGVSVERLTNSNGSANKIVRFIELNLQVIGKDDVANMLVSFQEDWDGNLDSIYFPRMPIADFEDIYKILQTEDPVYVRINIGEKKELKRFAISTNENEPTGEGPKD